MHWNLPVIPAMALVLMGCSSPGSTPAQAGGLSSTRSTGEKISPDLWSRTAKTSLPPYPALARLAGCQGIVVLDLEVDGRGEVVRASATNSRERGIGPLCATACAWAQQLKFPSTSDAGRTPKHYALYIEFKLPNRFGAGLSPEEIQLAPVGTPRPSFARQP